MPLSFFSEVNSNCESDMGIPVEIGNRKIIWYKSFQIMLYGDDIAIIGQKSRAIEKTIARLDQKDS